jgi:hypothetical protein
LHEFLCYKSATTPSRKPLVATFKRQLNNK